MTLNQVGLRFGMCGVRCSLQPMLSTRPKEISISQWKAVLCRASIEPAVPCLPLWYGYAFPLLNALRKSPAALWIYACPGDNCGIVCADTASLYPYLNAILFDSIFVQRYRRPQYKVHSPSSPGEKIK